MLPCPPCFRRASQLGLGPFRFAQRATAALRALALRCSGVSLLAVASPPFFPSLDRCRDNTLFFFANVAP